MARDWGQPAGEVNRIFTPATLRNRPWFRIAIGQTSDAVPGGSDDIGGLWADKVSVRLGADTDPNPALGDNTTVSFTRGGSALPVGGTLRSIACGSHRIVRRY